MNIDEHNKCVTHHRRALMLPQHTIEAFDRWQEVRRY